MGSVDKSQVSKLVNCEATNFTLIEDPIFLLPLLKSRLPVSSNIYNMALFSSKFKDVLKFYILGDGFDDETWIMTAFKREDYGMEYFLSTRSGVKITKEIENSFKNSKIFDWDSGIMFVVFDHAITIMLTEMCIRHGNATTVAPAHLYYTPITAEDPVAESCGVELKSLNSAEGLEFLCSNWKYCVDGSRIYVQKLLDRLPSVGCTVNENLASGIMTFGNGLMGMLHTDKNHRNKNYAKMCMQALIRKLANKGYQPSSLVETKNKISNSFHQKIGMIRAEAEACFVYFRTHQ